MCLHISYLFTRVFTPHPGMPSWPSAGGGKEKDDVQAVIAAGAGVPPPAGHSHSAGQLLQQQTDTPKVCEGEVSKVLPSCCCQTVQPAPLPIDLTLYSALCNMSVQYSFPFLHYLVNFLKTHIIWI